MYLYFIKNTTTNNFKIGKSENSQKRLKQLQTGNEHLLEVYKEIIINDQSTETYVHHHFKSQRLNGEWFNITKLQVDRVVFIISNIKQVKLETLELNELKLVAKMYGVRTNCKKQDMIDSINKIRENVKPDPAFIKSNQKDSPCVIL